MPTVSVLMATYNGAQHLRAQLESIRQQTHAPHELWVADDGSTDDTRQIVAEFAERVSFPVRLRLNTQSQGYGENFLSATSLCEGDFIAFCDQNDEWHPEKLERCIGALEREDALLCVHTATLIDAQSQYVGYYDQGIARSRTFPALTLPPWGTFLGMTQVFRRDLLALINIRQRGLDSHAPNSLLSHDQWIYFLAHSLGKIVTLAHPLAACRQQGRGAYGGRRTSFFHRLRARLAGPGEMLRRREAIALHRANLMAELGRGRPAVAVADQAGIAAIYWRRLGEFNGLRAQIYDAPTFAGRRLALSRLIRRGSYRAEAGGELSGWLLAKDVALGLMRFPLSWSSPDGRRPPGPSMQAGDKI